MSARTKQDVNWFVTIEENQYLARSRSTKLRIKKFSWWPWVLKSLVTIIIIHLSVQTTIHGSIKLTAMLVVPIPGYRNK